jgi:hypothetical protein
MEMSPDAVALRYLRYLVLREGGYTRLGVAGWALREDVERAIRLRLPERLPVLHGRGLLDREDVRAPGLSRPAWIYRVTQAGADHVAEQAALPRRAVLRPLRPAERDADAAIHIPAGAALALHGLRRAMEMRVESPFLPGETGWRTVLELRLQLGGEDRARPRWEPRTRRGAWEESDGVERGEAADPPAEPWMGDGDWMDRAVREEREEGWDALYGDTPLARAERTPWPADLEWLVRAGLAQKWIAHQPGRRAVPLYRITALGGVAIRLEWREPR